MKEKIVGFYDKKKSPLTSILATKTINLSVNEFYLTKRVPLSVFSHLNCLTNIFELEKIFCLGLSLSFLRHE
jgi:hypothetical protein